MKKMINRIISRLRSKQAVIVAGVFTGLFVLANLGVAVAFRNRSFPGTSIAGKSLGSVRQDEIQGRLSSLGLLPETVTLVFRDEDTKTSTEQLGIQVDTEKTAETVMQRGSWIPVVNLFARRDIEFTTEVDEQKLDSFVQEFADKHKKKPVNAKLTIKDGQFAVAADKAGYTLDGDHATSAILGAITKGEVEITLQPEPLIAATTAKELSDSVHGLKKQQQTKITLRYQGKSKTFTATEIAAWYEIKGSKAELTDAAISTSIAKAGASFGIAVQGLSSATTAVKGAVSTAKPLDLTLQAVPKPTRTFTYCVAAKGVSTAYLGALSAKLASTYADKRGWGLDGQVKLAKVTSGCDFTVWLAEASQVPTFGSVCDSTWSCRVGRNVIINFTRWQSASPAWNGGGGSLNDYRSMVINHETGHWFGFGHSYCGGAGQAAPVMQQQSINLQGCKFNPWPLASERQQLKNSLGL